MIILDKTLTIDELKEMAGRLFGDMVKAVVDTDRGLLSLDAELHSDLEALLLRNGSKQNTLWGINLYPEMEGDEFIEFDSMINVRPAQGNRSRSVGSQEVRGNILKTVAKWIQR